MSSSETPSDRPPDGDDAGTRYRSLLESLPWAFFACDAEGRLTDVNGAAERILGRSRDELIDVRFDRLVAVEDLSRAEELYRATMSGEVVHEEADFRVALPDGSRRTVRVALEVIHDDGEPVGTHGMFRDVTEERRAAARLARSEERLRLLLDRMPANVWTVDRELRITSVGGRFEVAGFVGRDLEALLEGAGGDVALEAHRRALEGEAVSYAYRSRGREWDARVETLREGEETVGAIGVALDVTEQAETERELRQQRSYLRALFELTPEAIVIEDEEGRVLDANPEFERLFGWSAEEARGRPLPDLIVPPDLRGDAGSLFGRVLGGERLETEAVRQRRDGSRVNVSILARPIRVGDDRRLLGIYRDITTRKLLEEQLLHAQRLDALGHLAGGVAHDFNNILTSIVGHVRELELATHEGQARDDLRQIEASAQRAATLVSQLLAFSRRGPAERRPTDLSAAVEELRDLLERTLGEGITLETRLDASVPPVSVDPVQLEQVIVNLLLNARDALEGSGVVRLHTRPRAGADGERRPEAVVLEVADEGRGMEDEVRARMFEPFFTTKGRADATGLGLSTVYGIVEQSRGTLEVDTAPGRGTTVRVVFPTTDAAEAGERESSPPAPGAGGPQSAGARVLLVEDDRPVREVTRRILERHGYEVLSAASGPEALRIARVLDRAPDLLLADVVMPGMTGVELADELAGIHPETRVLFMSGYTESELTTRAFAREPARLVSKPYDPATLLRRVREAVSSG